MGDAPLPDLSFPSSFMPVRLGSNKMNNVKNMDPMMFASNNQLASLACVGLVVPGKLIPLGKSSSKAYKS